MAKIIYAEEFLDDAAAIWSSSVQRHLVKALQAIEAFPELGSANIPESIRERYGARVRKMAICSFDLDYEYDSEADVVLVYGLVPFRQAR